MSCLFMATARCLSVPQRGAWHVVAVVLRLAASAVAAGTVLFVVTAAVIAALAVSSVWCCCSGGLSFGSIDLASQFATQALFIAQLGLSHCLRACTHRQWL